VVWPIDILRIAHNEALTTSWLTSFKSGSLKQVFRDFFCFNLLPLGTLEEDFR